MHVCLYEGLAVCIRDLVRLEKRRRGSAKSSRIPSLQHVLRAENRRRREHTHTQCNVPSASVVVRFCRHLGCNQRNTPVKSQFTRFVRDQSLWGCGERNREIGRWWCREREWKSV